jgi:hypothetical protein
LSYFVEGRAPRVRIECRHPDWRGDIACVEIIPAIDHCQNVAIDRDSRSREWECARIRRRWSGPPLSKNPKVLICRNTHPRLIDNNVNGNSQGGIDDVADQS